MQEHAYLIREFGLLAEEVYDNSNLLVGRIIENDNLEGHYQVLEQCHTISGFQGILIKALGSEVVGTDKLIFAFRGTEADPFLTVECLKDLFIADIKYMGSGTVPQQMKDAIAFVKAQIDEHGLNSDNTIFTGHSLGGALAGMASYVFGFDAYTYNGFGISNMLWDANDTNQENTPREVYTAPLSGQVIDNFITLGEYLETLGIHLQQSTDRIVNIVHNGYAASDLVGGILTNIISNQVGETHFVLNHTGDAGGLLANHNITSLNQSIAIYNNILKLFPNEDYGSLTEAVRFFSPADKKISRMLTCLGELVGVNTTGFTDHVQASKEIAEAHGTVGALSFGFLAVSSAGVLDSGATSSRIRGLNSANKADLYALLRLLPFTIEGDGALYNRFPELNENFSGQFTEDRKAFLYHLTCPDETSTDNIEFFDATLGIVAYSNLALPPETRVNYHFGGKAGDQLTGGDQSDHLYGLGGDDILAGGAGDDLLEGGEGIDTYIINRGDGHDTIIDKGRNILVIDGEAFAGVFLKVENTGDYLFIGDDENCTMVFNTAANLAIDDSTSLTFANQTSAADFTDNDFGLTLLESETADSFDVTLAGTDAINTSELGYFSGDNTVFFYGFSRVTTTRSDGTTECEWLFYQENVSLQTSFSLSGGAGNDRLVGLLGADHLVGGEGNDWLWGVDLIHLNPSTIPQGGDLLEGGAGIDWLNGSGGDDALHGGSDSDILVGLAGKDILMGEDGNDILVAGASDDITCGGDGDDILLGDGDLLFRSNLLLTDTFELTLEYEDGYLNGLTSPDIHVDSDSSAAGNDRLFGGAGNDYLNGGPGDDVLSGDTGNDILWGDNDLNSVGNDQLYGGTGDDLLHGAGGNDYLFGDTDNDTLFGNDGEDELRGGSGTDQLSGGAGHDLLSGDEGDDQLFGDQGADTLRGGAGKDRLYGGAGDDTYIVTPGDGIEYIEDQEGRNLILFEGVHSLASLEWMRATASPSGTASYAQDGHDLIIRYGSGNAVLLQGGITADFTFQLGEGSEYNRSEFFTAVAEYRLCESGNDTLSCDDSNNRIYAGDGNDTIHGLDGNDALSGGNGFHTAFLDMLRQYYPWLNEEQVSFASDLSFGGGTGVAKNNNDALYGDDGDDVLDGGVGFDYLSGGSGNDALYGDEGGDTLEGGDGDDLLIGGDEDLNSLRPGAQFDDLLFGGNGSDRLFGQSGDDQLEGGEGDDRLEGGLGDDSLSGGPGADILDGGEGEDTADYTGSGHGVTVDLATGIGLGGDAEGDLIVHIEHVYGSGSDDVLTGDEQENTIFGWGGDDTIHGGSGNDVLEGVGRLYGDDGNDILSGAGLLDGGDGDDDLRGSGTDGWGMGGADILIGGRGNDALYGDDGHDILRGGDGDDVFDGRGTGDMADGGYFDLMEGGAGNDTYLTDGANHFFDFVSDREGCNTIRYASAWSPHSLTITDLSVGFINADQQELAHLMAQEDRNNSAYREQLDTFINQIGKIGTWTPPESHQDLWISFQGRDVTDQDQCAVFVLLGGRSTDLNFTYDLGEGNVYTHAEILAQAMAGYTTPHCGPGNDAIEGDAFDNTFYGGAGDDEIYGDEGFDTLNGEDGNDHLYGGPGNDTLVGGDGDDQLSGDEGDDHLIAGAGNDLIHGSLGNDVYSFDRGDGQDNIDDYDLAVNTNILCFGDGLTPADILAIRPDKESSDLILRVNDSADLVRLCGYFLPDTEGDDGESYSNKVDRIEFANGIVWDQAMIQTLVVDNHAPALNISNTPLQAQAGQLYTFTIPAEAISDPDAWDTIVSWSLSMPNGSALPAWLSVDADTRTLSGTPENNDIGSLYLNISAADSCGASVEHMITLTITPANSAPVIVAALTDATITLGTPFSYTVAQSAFSDPDGGDLAYSATLADGDALPTWLSFDPVHRSFSGTPLSVGTTSVRVTVTDNGSLTVTDTFDLSVILLPTHTGTAGADSLLGGAGDDVITGRGGNDVLRGGSGNDVLLGGTGNDVLNGGLGADLLDGGEDRDTADYRGSAAGITVNLASGTAGGGTAQGDTLVLIENLYATEFDDILTGSDQANTLIGYGGNDLITALEGNDYLKGEHGNDHLIGGSGNDVLHGGLGADLLDGGEGRDSADYRGTAAGVVINLAANTASGGAAEGDSFLSVENIHATEFDDILTGSDQANTLIGYGGNDLITALEGNDYLKGEDGNDHLIGGSGNDVLHGGLGADLLDGGEGRDSADYRGTAAGVVINLAANTASGGAAEGDSFLSVENLYATEFDDILTGSDQANTLIGYGGNDLVNALEGNDYLKGEHGNDHLIGGSGNDVLHGGMGADLLDGGEGRDSADYRGTADGVVINLAANTASGGAAEGDSFLSVENLYATEFDDILIGSDQANTLMGYGGDDLLNGALGRDVLSGGLGNDFFVFDTAMAATSNIDSILDFAVGQDKIALSRTIFTALSGTEALDVAGFRSGVTGTAGGSTDFIFYNTTSGALFYDADGNGQGVALQFATLSNRPQLTASDFLVTA